MLRPEDLEQALQLDTHQLVKGKEKPPSHQSGIEQAGQMKAKFEGVSDQQKKHWEEYEAKLNRYTSFATEVRRNAGASTS